MKELLELIDKIDKHLSGKYILTEEDLLEIRERLTYLKWAQ